MRKNLVFVLLLCSLSWSSSVNAQGFTPPAKGKAVVYFVRYSAVGMLVPFEFYCNQKYIGRLKGKKYFRYETDPGQQLFWAVSENTDFVPCNLKAGGTYVVVVGSKMGLVLARVDFLPIDPSKKQHKKPLEISKKYIQDRSASITDPERIRKKNASDADYMYKKVQWYETKLKPNKDFRHLERNMDLFQIPDTVIRTNADVEVINIDPTQLEVDKNSYGEVDSKEDLSQGIILSVNREGYPITVNGDTLATSKEKVYINIPGDSIAHVEIRGQGINYFDKRVRVGKDRHISLSADLRPVHFSATAMLSPRIVSSTLFLDNEFGLGIQHLRHRVHMDFCFALPNSFSGDTASAVKEVEKEMRITYPVGVGLRYGYSLLDSYKLKFITGARLGVFPHTVYTIDGRGSSVAVGVERFSTYFEPFMKVLWKINKLNIFIESSFGVGQKRGAQTFGDKSVIPENNQRVVYMPIGFGVNLQL